MKLNKILIILTLFMSLFSLGYADLTTDNQGYYAFDDSNSSYNIFGATGTSDGMSFDGVNDYIDLSSNTVSDIFDINVEFKTDSTSGDRMLFSSRDDATSYKGVEVYFSGNEITSTIVGNSANFVDLYSFNLNIDVYDALISLIKPNNSSLEGALPCHL